MFSEWEEGLYPEKKLRTIPLNSNVPSTNDHGYIINFLLHTYKTYIYIYINISQFEHLCSPAPPELAARASEFATRCRRGPVDLVGPTECVLNDEASVVVLGRFSWRKCWTVCSNGMAQAFSRYACWQLFAVWPRGPHEQQRHIFSCK